MGLSAFAAAQDSHIGGSQTSNVHVVPPSGAGSAKTSVSGKNAAKTSGKLSGAASGAAGNTAGTATVLVGHVAAKPRSSTGRHTAANTEPEFNGAPMDPDIPVALSQEEFAALIVHRSPAIYPTLARSTHAKGVVVVDLTLDDQGKPDTADTIGPQDLGQAAIEAIKTWTFKPYIYKGHPWKANGSIRFEFLNPQKGTSE